jgi:flagella basal body P-ring formation protein FlgA
MASGSMALSIAAVDDNRVLARFPVSVRIRAWREVAAAASDLQRGIILTQNDIQFNEHEMTGVRAQPFENVDDLLGKRLVRMVRAGDVLTANHVENPPLVERGDEVLLLVQYNGITVGCLGKAAQKGGRGEKILVRNQYGRNLTGVITDAHTVMVTR